MGCQKLNFEIWIDLVNEVEPKINANDDFPEIYKKLEIESENGGYSRMSITKNIYNSIKEFLSDTNEKDLMPFEDFGFIGKSLVHKSVFEQNYQTDPIVIYKTVRDAMDKSLSTLPSLKNLEIWKKVLSLAKDLNVISNTHKLNVDQFREDYPRHYDEAEAALELSKKGVVFKLTDRGLSLLEGEKIILTEISNLIKSIGSKELAIFLTNEANYNKKMKRYSTLREYSILPHKTERAIPYGFLINYIAKYLGEKNDTSLILSTEIENLLYLSKLFVQAVYQSQPYSIWDTEFAKGNGVIELMKDISMFDTLYCFTQMNPLHSLEITEGLLKWIRGTEHEISLGYTVDEFLKVYSYVLNDTHEKGYFEFDSTMVLQNTDDLNSDTIDKILDDTSHKINEANSDYDYPGDYSSVDYHFKPITEINNNKFAILDRQLSAISLFDAFAFKLRNLKVKNLESEIGNAIEKFLYSKLYSKGISYCTGDYKVDGVAGEADLIIESENKIVLVEFKKKVLTRDAKSGEDVSLIKDLAKSLLASSTQCLRTEFFLRKNGQLELETANGTLMLQHNDREIERVSLTHMDFGGFQDRTIIIQLLSAFYFNSFHPYSTEESVKKEFAKLDELQEVFRDYVNKISSLNDEFKSHPFFNSWFISISQLLTVIEDSSDNNSFVENFCSIKHLSTKRLDFYFEYDYAKKMKI